MKYSVYAQCRGGEEVSAGHLTASSALDSLAALKQRGAEQIQVIDTKSGRLIDEAALARAMVGDTHMAKLRRGGSQG